MLNIAIFASGNGSNAVNLVKTFNSGNRIRVALCLTDKEDAPVIEKMKDLGIETLYLPDTVWKEQPHVVLDILREHDIKIIALDDFLSSLDACIENAYEGKILKDDDILPEAVMKTALNLGQEGRIFSENAKKEPPAMPKSVDDAWAEVLGVPNQVPPVPHTNTNPITPPPSEGRGASTPSTPMPPTFLVWSVICTLLCCTIPGIVAIINSARVSSRFYEGDFDGARRASHNAEIWIIVSFVLGVITATLYVPFMIASGL